MKYYVQVRRGGFSNPAPWGEKLSPFISIESALEHIKGVAEMADKYNCCIDYIITDENNSIVAKG